LGITLDGTSGIFSIAIDRLNGSRRADTGRFVILHDSAHMLFPRWQFLRIWLCGMV
jgi:hypothetical protein